MKQIIPGGMIHDGNNSNYIFFFPEKNNKSIIQLDPHNIQKYKIKHTGNVNSEYYSIFKNFDSFRDLEDSLLLEISSCKSNKCRDKKISSAISFLKKMFNLNLDFVSNKSINNEKVKLFYYHFYLSEFCVKEKITKLCKSFNTPNDFIGIKNKLILECREIESKPIAISNSEKQTILKIINLENKVDTNHIILLDFWASWCGPCRRENRTFLQHLNKNFNKLVDIVSISLDKEFNNWKKAEKEDSIIWHSIILDKKTKDELKQEYSINSLPFKIFITKDKLFKGIENEKILEHLSNIYKTK